MTKSTENDVSKKTSKKQQKRRSGEEIIDRLRVAASTEFANNGFTRTKTATIAEKAGVSETLLFRYFGSKANLFNDAIFEPFARKFGNFSERKSYTDIDAEDRKLYIKEMQGFVREHAQAIMLLIFSKSFESEDVRGIDKLTDLHKYFENSSNLVKARSSHASDLGLKLMACISFSTVLSCELFRDWLFPEGWGTDEDIEDAVVNFILAGLAAQTGEPKSTA